MFFNKKNKWNQDVKLNFENFEFWTLPISKFALVRIIVYQFYNLKLKIYMVFTEKFEFCFQIFITWILRNSICQTSEAPLPSILYKWKKSLSSHDFSPKVQTNFGWKILKLHSPNYHNVDSVVLCNIDFI